MKSSFPTRIPPSTAKLDRGRSHSRNDRSRSRSRSRSRQDSKPPEMMEVDPLFAKLDPSDPVHSRRMSQRRKAVSKGKNTVGYHEYRQQVPKEKRRARSMDTPSTPDPTLDIPAKRWQGMLRAWRVALHNYDPQDLMASVKEAPQPFSPKVGCATACLPDEAVATAAETPLRAKELKKAAALGLVVDFDPTEQKTMEEGSPISVLSEEPAKPCRRLKKLENWGDLDSDSDDDLL